MIRTPSARSGSAAASGCAVYSNGCTVIHGTGTASVRDRPSARLGSDPCVASVRSRYQGSSMPCTPTRTTFATLPRASKAVGSPGRTARRTVRSSPSRSTTIPRWMTIPGAMRTGPSIQSTSEMSSVRGAVGERIGEAGRGGRPGKGGAHSPADGRCLLSAPHRRHDLQKRSRGDGAHGIRACTPSTRMMSAHTATRPKVSVVHIPMPSASGATTPSAAAATHSPTLPG